MDKFTVIVVFWCGLFSNYADCYKILGIFPMVAHSHHTLANRLLKELAARGHHVTVISPYPQKTPIENYTDVALDNIIETMNDEKKHLYDLEQHGAIKAYHFMVHFGNILTEKTLQSRNVQTLLQSNETFDLVLMAQFLNEAHMAFALRFKAPLVVISAMPQFAWNSFMSGHPTASSYIPNVLSDFTTHMTFGQRVCNSFFDMYNIMHHRLVVLPKHREMARKYVSSDADLYDAADNISLVLINSHMSVYNAIPRPPNVIEIGGFHLVPAKDLPTDLKTFLDSSKQGVIVFSMGSNLKSVDLPDVKRDAILNVFSKLKQNVLWKWENDNMPGQPNNVKVMKWLPQNDVLAHPNVHAFISHGGLLSTMESIYHGVPMVGVPIFADQKMNIATAVSNGYAVTVPFQEISESTLSQSLDEILNNPKYKENARKRSRIMKDQPMRPLDTAVYWIEYVIRHKGAEHLRYAGANLTWFQRNLLDVATFYVVLIIIVVGIICYVIKLVCSKASCFLEKRKTAKIE